MSPRIPPDFLLNESHDVWNGVTSLVLLPGAKFLPVGKLNASRFCESITGTFVSEFAQAGLSMEPERPVTPVLAGNQGNVSQMEHHLIGLHIAMTNRLLQSIYLFSPIKNSRESWAWLNLGFIRMKIFLEVLSSSLLDRQIIELPRALYCTEIKLQATAKWGKFRRLIKVDRAIFEERFRISKDRIDIYLNLTSTGDV